MRNPPPLLFKSTLARTQPRRQLLKYVAPELEVPILEDPIINIKNGTFYRQYPSTPGSDDVTNPALFPKLKLSIPSTTNSDREQWCIIGGSSAGKTTLLEILRGRHLCLPPSARTFPHLASKHIAPVDSRLRTAENAIQYVGFSGEEGGLGGSGTRGAYLSARYESRREETDFLLRDYLVGNTNLNIVEETVPVISKDAGFAKRVLEDFGLENYLGMPMGNLSNGQTRRARIVKALLGHPLILLLDEPFMGLDPPTIQSLNPILEKFAAKASPRLVFALRPQDPIPEWTTHVIMLGPNLHILACGTVQEVIKTMRTMVDQSSQKRSEEPPPYLSSFKKLKTLNFKGRRGKLEWLEVSREGLRRSDDGPRQTPGKCMVEMEGVKVKYGQKTVLGDWNQVVNGEPKSGLWWTVRAGERWGIFGPNGNISLVS